MLLVVVTLASIVAAPFSFAGPVDTSSMARCSPVLDTPAEGHITYNADSMLGWQGYIDKFGQVYTVGITSIQEAEDSGININWTVKQVNGTDKFRIFANTEEAKCVASVRDRVAYNDCANEGDHNLWHILCDACSSSGGVGCTFQGVADERCATVGGEFGPVVLVDTCGDPGSRLATQLFTFGQA